jgi:hypothetical protein
MPTLRPCLLVRITDTLIKVQGVGVSYLRGHHDSNFDTLTCFFLLYEKNEKYPDSIVIVAGDSAYWVDLGKPLRDDIIQGNEQSLC